MFSRSRASRGSTQAAEPSEVDPLLPPSSPPPFETANGDSERGVVTEKPYSVFTNQDKWWIVGFAAFSALFSPFTANIYLPAIPAISRDFHKSIELINLTVTVFMVMQGTSPMMWGTLSDRWGRRPIIFACLAILSLSCVGLALVPTSAYWLLVLLRCVQATGSASTIALGAGIIADIATPVERGGFFGLYGMGQLVGPCLGPVIGGALAQSLGWRSIFWFLCVSSATCGLVLFLFLPETLRSIVGDGSIRAGRIYTPLIPVIGRHRIMRKFDQLPPRKPFTNPLLMFTYPDIFVLLIFNGTYYAVMYGVTTSLSVIFADIYPHLTEAEIGLCFLPMGGGMIVGSWVSGKLSDYYYRKIRDDIILQARSNSESHIDVNALEKGPAFPIEEARLRILPLIAFVYTASVIGYGWALESKVTIVVPLILQIFIGMAAVTVLNSIQTLLVDLIPDQGSSITACNNIIRCSLGAGMVSVINPLLVALGKGWTYTLLGGLCMLVSPLLYIEIRWGPMWRERRRKEQG